MQAAAVQEVSLTAAEQADPVAAEQELRVPTVQQHLQQTQARAAAAAETIKPVETEPAVLSSLEQQGLTQLLPRLAHHLASSLVATRITNGLELGA